MHDIIFTIVKLVVMVLALVVSRYLIPWLKERISIGNLETAINWASRMVLYAQQVLTDSTGEEKKEIVIGSLRNLFKNKGINISEDELNVLIEAAVKEMKMQTQSTKNESEGE